MTFTYIYPLFQIHFLRNSLSHSLSHLNIISSFIIYSFFNNYTSFNIFFYSTHYYYNRKKNLRMNKNPSDLMSYYSWAKKKFGYREFIGVAFFGLILYYRENFAFA